MEPGPKRPAPGLAPSRRNPALRAVLTLEMRLGHTFDSTFPVKRSSFLRWVFLPLIFQQKIFFYSRSHTSLPRSPGLVTHSRCAVGPPSGLGAVVSPPLGSLPCSSPKPPSPVPVPCSSRAWGAGLGKRKKKDSKPALSALGAFRVQGRLSSPALSSVSSARPQPGPPQAALGVIPPPG